MELKLKRKIRSADERGSLIDTTPKIRIKTIEERQLEPSQISIRTPQPRTPTLQPHTPRTPTLQPRTPISQPQSQPRTPTVQVSQPRTPQPQTQPRTPQPQPHTPTLQPHTPRTPQTQPHTPTLQPKTPQPQTQPKTPQAYTPTSAPLSPLPQVDYGKVFADNQAEKLKLMIRTLMKGKSKKEIDDAISGSKDCMFIPKNEWVSIQRDSKIKFITKERGFVNGRIVVQNKKADDGRQFFLLRTSFSQKAKMYRIKHDEIDLLFKEGEEGPELRMVKKRIENLEEKVEILITKINQIDELLKRRK